MKIKSKNIFVMKTYLLITLALILMASLSSALTYEEFKTAIGAQESSNKPLLVDKGQTLDELKQEGIKAGIYNPSCNYDNCASGRYQFLPLTAMNLLPPIYSESQVTRLLLTNSSFNELVMESWYNHLLVVYDGNFDLMILAHYSGETQINSQIKKAYGSIDDKSKVDVTQFDFDWLNVPQSDGHPSRLSYLNGVRSKLNRDVVDGVVKTYDSVYVAQEDISVERVAYDLGLDASKLKAKNPGVRSIFTGDMISVPKETNLVQFGYSPWQAWQLYGTLRGYDYFEFALYNTLMNTLNSGLNIPESELRKRFDPYADTTYKRYYLNKSFDSTYISGIDSKNKALLTQINNLDKSTRTHQIGTSITLPNEDYLKDISILDIQVVSVDRDLIDSSTLSMGAIASSIFERLFDKNAVDPFLIMIVPDKIISISYDFSSVIADTGYFDDLLKGTDDTSDLSTIIESLKTRKNELDTLTGSKVALYAGKYLDEYQDMPYVYGGESPYSVTDTRTNSLFEGVDVTEKQPFTNQPTVPGFDSAGFIWYTLKTTGLDISRMDVKGIHQYAMDNWENIKKGKFEDGDIVFQDSYVGILVDDKVIASTIKYDGLNTLELSGSVEAYRPPYN